jgi:HAD superfamily hydrolase (TIGR01509 family)
MHELVTLLQHKQSFIWDFDGCLFDSERSHYEAYSKAFAHFGHVIHELAYYASFTNLGGGTHREIAAHGLSCTAQEIAVLKDKYYKEIIERNAIPAYPEIPEILERLRRHDRQVAIASNSSPEDLHALLDNQGLRDRFHVVVGKTAQMRSKPEPDLYLLAMQELNAKLEQTLILEDTDRGLEAAARAQCDALWLRSRHNEGITATQPHRAGVTHSELLAALRIACP